MGSASTHKQFCAFCHATREQKADFGPEDVSSKARESLRCWFDFIPKENFIFCALHGMFVILYHTDDSSETAHH